MARKKIEYPVIKKIAWRFGRTFVAVFLTLFAAGLPQCEDFGAVKSLAISASAGAIVAAGKAVREWFEENRNNLYESLVKKLPV